MEAEHDMATLMSMSNGYMGVRGSLTNEAVKVTADGKNSGEISLTLCGEERKLAPGQEMQKYLIERA